MNALIDQTNMFYWKGPQTTLLIDRFRQTCPLEHVMTCSSGTAALHIAVAAAGIAPGDEVITSPISDIGTVIGVLYQQAVPVFADLGRSTYNLDPEDVARRITPKTKAIIAVHLAGNPCDIAGPESVGRPAQADPDRGLRPGLGAKLRQTDRHGGPHRLLLAPGRQARHQRRRGVVASSDPGSARSCNGSATRDGPARQRGPVRGLRHQLPDERAAGRTSPPPSSAASKEIAEKRARLGNLLNEKLQGAPGIEPHQVHADDRST